MCAVSPGGEDAPIVARKLSKSNASALAQRMKILQLLTMVVANTFAVNVISDEMFKATDVVLGFPG